MKLHRAVLLLSAGAALACKGSSAPARQRPPPAVTSAAVWVRDVPVEVRAPVDLRPLAQADVGVEDARLPRRGARRSRRPGEARAARGAGPPERSARSARGRARHPGADAGPGQLWRAPTSTARRSSRRPASSRSRSSSRRESALATAEAAQQAAQSQIGGLAVRLGETRIDSPLDGVVSARRLDPGRAGRARLGAARSSPSRGSTCCACSSPSTSATSRSSGSGRTRTSSSTRSRAGASRARWCASRPRFDPATRTLDAEVQLPNADGELRPGMYGRGAIVIEIHRDALVVPASRRADLRRQAATCSSSRATRCDRRAVQVGVDGGDWLEVTAGLQAGDEIVTAGIDGLVGRRAGARLARTSTPFTGKPLAPRPSSERTERHVAHPPRAPQPGLHPDDVADDASCSARSRCAGSRSTSSPTSTSRSSASRPSTRAPGRPTSRSRSPQPIERAVGASPGVDRVESTSKQGVSVVSVWFNYGTNLDNAQFEVLAARRADPEHAAARHPAAVHHQVRHHRTSPSCRSPMSGEGLDEQQLYDLAYNIIEPQLERMPGVASADRRRRQDRARSRSRSQPRRAARPRPRHPRRGRTRCATSNLLLPSGNLRAGDRDYNVFTNTQVAEARPLERRRRARRRRAHAARAPPPVRVSDVADVDDAHRRPDRDRPRQRPARRLPPRAQAAGRQHHRGRRRGARRRCRSCAACRRTCSWRISFDQSTYIRVGRQLARARGGAGRAARHRGDPVLPRQPARDRHHRRRHPAVDRRDVRPALLHRADAQRLHAGRARARRSGGSSTTRSSSWRTSIATSAMGQSRKQRGAGRGAGGGDAHPGLHHHDHRRLLPGALPGRRRAQPVHAAGAHDRLRAHHELLRLAHGDAAPLPLLAASRGTHGEAAARRAPAAISRAARRASTTPTRARCGWVLAPPRA